MVAGAGNPTGTIEFRDGATRLGTVTLVSGSAALSTNGLGAGSHFISATYSGDPNFAGGTQSMTHVVNSSAASSSTAVASSSNPAATGATLTVTATVTYRPVLAVAMGFSGVGYQLYSQSQAAVTGL